MRRLCRTVFLSACVIVVATCVAAAGYYAYLNTHPEILANFVEEAIAKRLGKAVTVEKATVLPGLSPQVILTNVTIGTSDELYLAAEHLGAHLALHYILFGKIKIDHMDVRRPEIRIPWHCLKGGAAIGDFEAPPLDIAGGRIIITKESAHLIIDEVQGSISKNSAQLCMHILGGEAAIKVSRGIVSVQGTLNLNNIALDRIDPRMNGTFDIKSEFQAGIFRKVLSVAANAKNVRLPWLKGTLDEVNIALDGKGTVGGLNIENITLKTKVFNMGGSGRISQWTGIGAFPDSLLELTMQSSEVDYETLVDLLPLKHFPEWLSLLLDRQIRDGTIHFSRVAYKGSLGDIFTADGLIKGLTVRAALKNQSFGAGHDPSRVEQIQGQCLFSKGRIAFRDLSGRVGTSSIHSVNLVFWDILQKGVQLSVGVGADMPLSDFITAWKAVMTPRELYDLLGPISHVEGGRIAGRVDACADTSKGDATLIRGTATLSGAHFRWLGYEVEASKATAHRGSYDEPLKIQAAGSVRGHVIDSLELIIPHPLKSPSYVFSLWTKEISNMPGSAFFEGHSPIQISGRGEGPHIEGEVLFSAESVRLLSEGYRPKEGMIEGRGKVKATLWPETVVELPELVFTMAPGTLKVHGAVKGSAGRFGLKGTIDLAQVAVTEGARFEPEKGFIDADLEVTWREETAITGTLACRKACLVHRGEPLEFDGSLTVGRALLSSPRFSITYRDMSAQIVGDLSLSTPESFEGTVNVDSLKIEKSCAGKGGWMPPCAIKNTTVVISRAQVYGIPVDSIIARLEGDGERLCVMDLRADLLSGTVTGKADVKKTGGIAVDLDVSMEKIDIGTLLTAMYPEEPKFDGTATIKGRLWGPVDLINGDISFAAAEGRIKKYALLSKIFAVLNPYKIIRSGEIDFAGEGFSYNKMAATFQIRDGILRSDDFYFDSDSLQASAAGSYQTNDKKIDMTVIVQPLETIDKIIGLIPIVGWIVTGEKNRFVVICLKVQGSADNPSITLAPVDTISEPVTGILLRILKLPVEIVRNPRNMIPSLK